MTGEASSKHSQSIKSLETLPRCTSQATFPVELTNIKNAWYGKSFIEKIANEAIKIPSDIILKTK